MLSRSLLIIHDGTFTIGTAMAQIKTVTAVLVKPDNKEASW